MDYGPRRIDLKVIRALAKLPPPPSPKEVWDSQQRLCLRHQPSGYLGLYAVAQRQRKSLCNARDVLDATRPQTLRWAVNEARKFQGKAAAGELEPARNDRVPTLREFLVGPCKRTFGEAVAKSEVDRLLALFPGLLNRRLDKIVPLDMARWAKSMDGAKPSTVERHARMLHSALEKAHKWKLIKENPLAGAIRRDKGRLKIADIPLEPVEHRIRYLSADEEGRLRAAIEHRSDYIRPAVLVSLGTGLRQGELLKLRWRAVDFTAKVVTVTAETAKSRKVRHVPINAEVLQTLKAWKQEGAKPDDFVFTSPYGHPIISPKKAWGRLIREARIENFTWHDMRHDFASKLVMARVGLYVVKELLGHASITQTEKYAHLQPDVHSEAVEKISMKRAK